VAGLGCSPETSFVVHATTECWFGWGKGKMHGRYKLQALFQCFRVASTCTVGFVPTRRLTGTISLATGSSPVRCALYNPYPKSRTQFKHWSCAWRACGLTLPSRGRFPAYGLQAPLMSNVRALASIRVMVIHRPVACVATVGADCPSFGGQRKVEPPPGRDSWFTYEPRARRRRCGVWLPFAAGKKSGTRTVPNT
jgi:hypothetical protein